MRACWMIWGGLLGWALSPATMAADTSPGAQLERFSAEAARPGNVQAGQQFFLKKHGNDWSCASCHGEVPVRSGRHASTGKVLEPLAPAVNAKSLTEGARVDKWFRRNCKDVLGRECSAGEKADVLAWLISLR
jgi:mono/diheme cytochrome c family protein